MIAIEEAPDEGLEQPLRLDKLANEVHPLNRTFAAVHGPCTSAMGKLIVSVGARSESRNVAAAVPSASFA